MANNKKVQRADSLKNKIVLSFSTKITVPSKVVEGIFFVLLNVSEKLRRTVALELYEQFDRLTQIGAETAKIAAEDEKRTQLVKLTLADKHSPTDKGLDEAVPDDPEILAKLNELNRRANALIDNEVDPVYVEQVVVLVQGLEIDGDEGIDGKKLFEVGPRDLYEEALKLVRKQFGLGPDEVSD